MIDQFLMQELLVTSQWIWLKRRNWLGLPIMWLYHLL